jgi:pimeloyl-ACP methyl ester carboxylesterase
MSLADRLSINSTNVRNIAFRAWAALAPASAEARAAELFARPVRLRRARTPPPGRPFRIDAGRERLVAWDIGEGPTILLVHGWNGHAGQMRPFVAPLVDAGFHVVAFDHPGHGESTGDRATLPDFADAVRAVAWRVRPIHGIVAHSLGASAAAIALARDVHAESAVLIAPPLEVTHFVRQFSTSLGLPERLVPGVVARIRDEVGDLDALDGRRVAPSVHASLLVVHDPDDREVPYAHGQAVASAAPHARLLPVPGLGHRGPLRDPRVIATTIAFLRAREAGRVAA